MRIAEADIWVADCETTGLDYAAGDRIVEFAARSRRDGTTFDTLVNPGRHIPIVTQAVHGITDRMVAAAPTLDEAYAQINAALPFDAVLCFHQASFDTTMLPFLGERRVLCSKRLAQHLVPEAPAHKNQVLRYYFGGEDLDLEGGSPHRALADVIVTSFVLPHLIERYLENGGVDDIDALIALAEAPIPMTHFPAFGKHKGWPLVNLPLSYVDWCLTNLVGPEDADLRWNLQRELSRRNEVAA